MHFDATGDERFLELGRERTVAVMAPHLTHVGVHDHGFNNISTYGNLWRLMNEGRLPEDRWQRRFYELALKASGAVQAAHWMIDQRKADAAFSGVIVNISSVSATEASSNRGDYCISQAGVAMSTQLWAHRLAEFGIAVYEVRPGIIRTDMSAPVAEKYDRLVANGLTVEYRWGTPEDVGRAVAMLARGELTYATGNVLNVDGGLTLRRL